VNVNAPEMAKMINDVLYLFSDNYFFKKRKKSEVGIMVGIFC
jgi:hypothetical protein